MIGLNRKFEVDLRETGSLMTNTISYSHLINTIEMKQGGLLARVSHGAPLYGAGRGKKWFNRRKIGNNITLSRTTYE